ncbi:MAG: CDP-diacylglycerol--serine O-phosphatidyltransferase [Desulfurispora sp.]|uniref:CDP-diacylglycerol--serine O-phosphatidyltransferase n=1 Tax=Desulfurispora sp. TaxID=3014275 RepID=UPI004049DC46
MTKKIIASAITSANLLAGVLALVNILGSSPRYQLSAFMILLAAVLDGLDGRVARRLGIASEFGKELDSLADLVSFGVAPAMLFYGLGLGELGWPGLLGVLLFVLCGALRLARFNVLNIKTYFLGVPITIAGSLAALLALISLSPYVTLHLNMMLAFLLLLSWLMVSKIKIPKF